jgi:carboxymethylenebutenolidase
VLDGALRLSDFVPGICWNGHHSGEGCMSEETVEIRTADGIADGYVHRPSGGGSAPGVLMLTDVGGLRPASLQLSERLAEQGFVVLTPNVFYRTAKPPMFTFTPNFAEERTQKRFAELVSPLKPDAIERDAAAFLDFLGALPDVKPGKFGVAGYCFTGGYAMRVAASQPNRVAAVASFHGGGLCTDAETSPHRVLPQIKARLYFGHATKDRSMPQEAIDKLDQALAAWGGKFETEVYEGAYHGWTMPGHQAHNPVQADRALTKLTELFAQTLK